MENNTNNATRHDSADVNTNFMAFFTSNGIEIPLIQRDYVQGSDQQAEKRDAFTDSLFAALTDTGRQCELDFIYGTFDHGAFIPLDGQQRLTTLYLLHWFLLNKCRIVAPDDYAEITAGIDFKANSFTYKTRRSSTAFCQKLADYSPAAFSDKISEEIENQTWFSEDWRQDPSVMAMLNMLDALNAKASQYPDGDTPSMLRRLLDTNAINFDKLDMESYRLTDSLYVKMNARGKQLTEFENWKAKFILYLEENYKGQAYLGAESDRAADFGMVKDYFTHSIEHEWTDMFWRYAVDDYKKRKADYDALNDDERALKPEPAGPLVDGFFINFYYYVYRMLSFISTAETDDNGKNSDHGTPASRSQLFKSIGNIEFLFGALDLFVNISRNNADGVAGFFNDLFYIDGTKTDGSVRLFSSERTDLFETCITDGSVDEQVMLFCIIKYCMRYRCYTATDLLKKYARVCRNLLETITQRLANDMKMHSNVRLSDLKKYVVTIDSLCSAADVATLPEISSGMGSVDAVASVSQWMLRYPDADIYRLEDSDYTHGSLYAFSDKPSMADQLNALEAFRAATDIERSRVLVAFGYMGADFGRCAHGSRRFFGYIDRWDAIFRYRDEADELRAAFGAFTDEYRQCNSVATVIDNRLHDLKSRAGSLAGFETFEYYYLKYDAFANSSLWWIMDKSADAKDVEDAHHFFAMYPDNYYDIVTLPRFSSNPLLGYNTEPYSCAVAQYFRHNDEDIYKKIDYTGKDRNRTRLTFKDNNVTLEITSDGWRIDFVDDDNGAPIKQLTANDVKALPGCYQHSDGKLYVKVMDKDMVESAIDFITALC